MAQIDAADAFALAEQFRKAGKAVGDWLFDHWDQLSPTDREALRARDLSLLSFASDLTTHAIGIVLDEGQIDLGKLKSAAQKTEAAVATINDIKKIIKVTAALISLAAAIPTGNIGAIVASAQGVADALGIQIL